MAQTLDIAGRETSYAIGMGWFTGEEGDWEFEFPKVFGHRNQDDETLGLKANDEPVRDFQAILVELGLYGGMNEEIFIDTDEIDDLIESFEGHNGTISFLKGLKEQEDATGFFVIMHYETPPATQLQAELLSAMFRAGQM